MKIKASLMLGGLLGIVLSAPLFAYEGDSGSDMLREEREQLESLKQPGVDLPANLQQNLDPAMKKACLEKDEGHMLDRTKKYSCMEGYQNIPQIDVGDLNEPAKGEHPVFQNRMKED